MTNRPGKPGKTPTPEEEVTEYRSSSVAPDSHPNFLSLVRGIRNQYLFHKKDANEATNKAKENDRPLHRTPLENAWEHTSTQPDISISGRTISQPNEVFACASPPHMVRPLSFSRV